jgi:hypothetical protein
MTSPSTEQQIALQDEVAHLISEAMRSRTILAVSAHAARLADTYRLAGLTEKDICALIVRLAVPSNIALELATPEPPPTRP